MFGGRRAERDAARGETECALRVVAGEHAGLGHRWRHGIARVSTGTIVFRPYLWQVRIVLPWTATVEVDVVSTEEDTDGSPWREVWSVNPTARRIVVQASGATLLWALPERQADWALGRTT